MRQKLQRQQTQLLIPTEHLDNKTGNMSSNNPTLLALPRELRNEIYNYLHCEIRFSGYLRSSPADHTVFSVYLLTENAPLLSVLLVNNQIRCEYLESKCFADLRATILYGLISKTMPDEDEDCPNIDKVLACVHHLTILTHPMAGIIYGGQWLLLPDAVMEKSPNVSSVRFVLETHYVSLETHKSLQALLDKSLAANFPRQRLLIRKTFANMNLNQQGHGYYVSHLGLPQETIVFREGEFFEYEVTSFRVLLYVRENSLPDHRRFDDVLGDLIELAPSSRDEKYAQTKSMAEEFGIVEWVEDVCGEDDTEPWILSI